MENTNEIMTFEEIKNTEEIVETEKDNSAKVIAGVGLAGLVAGFLTHKYGKPIVSKIKAKVQNRKNGLNEKDIIEVEFEESVEEN